MLSTACCPQHACCPHHVAQNRHPHGTCKLYTRHKTLNSWIVHTMCRLCRVEPLYIVWSTCGTCRGQHDMHMPWRMCRGQHRKYMVWTTSMSSTPCRACVPQHEECHPRCVTHGMCGHVVDNIEWVHTVEYLVDALWACAVDCVMHVMWVHRGTPNVHDVGIHSGLPNTCDVGTCRGLRAVHDVGMPWTTHCT